MISTVINQHNNYLKTETKLHYLELWDTNIDFNCIGNYLIIFF